MKRWTVFIWEQGMSERSVGYVYGETETDAQSSAVSKYGSQAYVKWGCYTT